MKPFLLILCALGLCLTACDDDTNEDQAKTVDKDGSVEVALSTRHIDTANDELISHYVVWRKGIKIKEFNVRDTVASLGKVKADQDDGDAKDVTVPRDYEFFVTVK